MDKIIQYGMCTGNNHEELAGFVNEQLRNGYQPFGHPFTTVQHDILFIHQAMVLYEIKRTAKTKLKLKSELF